MMKQRLIGALVLLCGGVILWSLLFTGPAASKLDRHSQIPAAPQFESSLAVEPVRPEGITPAETELVPPQPIVQIDDEVEAKPSSAPVAVVSKPAPAPSSATPEKPKAAVAKPAPVTKSGLDRRGLPLAWVVQVGVFGNADNAAALKKSLQGAGYKAFTDQIQRNGKHLNRVLVGPVLSEDKALAQQAEINARFNVKSIVNRFEP